MIKRETPYLLCEALCDAIRQRLEHGASIDTAFFFDYEGPLPVSVTDVSVIQTIAERLLRYSGQFTESKGVFYRVIVSPLGLSECKVHLRVAALAILSGEALGADAAGAEPVDAEQLDPDLALADTLCRSLQGGVRVARDAGGTVVDAEFHVKTLAPADVYLPAHADNAAAWLIANPMINMKMLARRLQRMGWQVRVFETAGAVEAALSSHPTAGSAPALVVGSGHRGVTLAEMARLRQALPEPTQLVLQVLQSVGAESTAPSGVEVHAVPLSPRRLLHYAELARESGLRPSGHTRPGALEPAGKPAVLVVDDIHVNLTLAKEILTMLGYTPWTAVSGEGAVELCQQEAPAAVLMDLTMPGMGGIEAARQLRAAQGAGQLARFPIVAVSAVSNPELLPGYAGARFDAALAKPIDIPGMRATLSRLLGIAASTSVIA